METSEMVITKRLLNALSNVTELKVNEQTYSLRFMFESQRNTDTDIYLRVLPSCVAQYNYFSYNKANKITCWPIRKGEQPFTDVGTWVREGRIELRPAKFMQLVWPHAVVHADTDERELKHDNPDEAELLGKLERRACEIFTATISGVNAELDYDITDKVGNVYRLHTSHDSGSLCSSCMRRNSGHSCSKYPKFYDLTGCTKVLYGLTQDGRLRYRALLWEVTIPGITDKVEFLDRIYGTEPIQQQLRIIASDNGWAYRTENGYIAYNDRYVDAHADIRYAAVKYLHETGSAYIDTLHYLSKVDGKWRLSNKNNNAIHSIHSASGLTFPILRRCRHCGALENSRVSMLIINGRNVCNTCVTERYTHCPTCHTHVHRDKLIDTSTIPNGDGTVVCEHCYSTIGLCKCHRCDKMGLKSHYHHHIPNGAYFCMECYEDIFKPCTACGKRFSRSHLLAVIVDNKAVHLCNSCVDAWRGHIIACRDCGSYHTGAIPRFNFVCDNCILQAEAAVAHS